MTPLVHRSAIQATPLPLNPIRCRDAQDWERTDIAVEQLPHSVPVFTPPHQALNSESGRNLSIALLLLTGRIGPRKMASLLHPSLGSDLAVYASDGRAVCGSNRGPGIMGQYLPDRHAVVLYPALEQVVVARRLLGISISDFSETFIHEFAHHIYFQILAGHSPEHSIWDLYQWTVRQGMVRESSSPLARSRGIGRDFRGYYPNDIYRGVFGFPHSGSNDLEFFAELFTEYVNSTFNPNPAGGVFARRDLMESFLSGAEEERLRPEVFLENRLRKAYNYYGLAYAPIRWLPDFRLEAVFGSRLETGVSLFVGAKDFHPRHFFGFGVMGGVEASIPGGGLTGSLKAEFATGANLRLMIPTELAALMRLGAKTDGVSFWSSFDLGLRVTVGIPPRGHWRGFNISAGFFEEMSIQLGFSSYGTLGLGYTF